MSEGGKEPRTKKQQKYKRPVWFWQMVGAWTDISVKPSISAKCAEAGIDRSTWYRHCADPQFVADFEAAVARITAIESAEVRTSLRRLIFEGQEHAIQAAELWFTHFEPKVRVPQSPRKPGKPGKRDDVDSLMAQVEAELRSQEASHDRFQRLLDRLENEEEG